MKVLWCLRAALAGASDIVLVGWVGTTDGGEAGVTTSMVNVPLLLRLELL